MALVGGAQAPAANQPGTEAVARAIPAAYGCPVELSARRSAVGDIAYAGGSGEDAGSNGVHVRLTAREGQRIREASLTVHALSARGRVMPAAANAEPDIAKQFQLSGGNTGAAELGGGAFVRGRATVVFVDVDELRYADGRVWRPAAGASCRVEPDGFLPVAALR